MLIDEMQNSNIDVFIPENVDSKQLNKVEKYHLDDDMKAGNAKMKAF